MFRTVSNRILCLFYFRKCAFHILKIDSICCVVYHFWSSSGVFCSGAAVTVVPETLLERAAVQPGWTLWSTWMDAITSWAATHNIDTCVDSPSHTHACTCTHIHVHAHAHTHRPLHSSLLSTGWIGLSILAQKAVMEVFINHTGICEVPRTGKPFLWGFTMKQKGEKGERRSLGSVLPHHWRIDINTDWYLSSAFHTQIILWKKKKGFHGVITSITQVGRFFQQVSRFAFIVFIVKTGQHSGAWVACHAAVHFQYIIAVIIHKWVQLVKCQAWFVRSQWLADKPAQRCVKRVIAVGFYCAESLEGKKKKKSFNLLMITEQWPFQLGEDEDWGKLRKKRKIEFPEQTNRTPLHFLSHL